MPNSDGAITAGDMCSQSVIARVLSDGSVESIKIAASIQSDNFSSGVSGWKIERDTGSAEFQDVTVRGTLNADDITAGTLAAARIAAGSLDAAKITVGTITADRIILGSPDNLIQNPGAETNSLTPHNPIDAGGSWSVDTTPRSGAYAFKYDSTSQSSEATLQLNGSFDMDYNPAAVEGDVFYFEAWGEYAGTGSANEIWIQMKFRDELDANLGTSQSVKLAPTTTPQLMTVSGTAPAGTAYVAFALGVDNDGNVPSGGHLFDDCYARRKVGTLVIEDQAVDVARQLDPVFTDADWDRNSNQSWSTTDAVKATDTITVPAWVGTLSVLATANIRNYSTAAQLFEAWIEIGGTKVATNISGTTGNSDTYIDGGAQSAKLISSPGATVDVKTWGQIFFGSTASTGYDTHQQYIAVGIR